MKILNAEAVLVPVDELTPHPNNPRQGDVGAIAESIEQNGWYGTIVAQVSTKRILAGNHRWQAAKSLGFEEVPVAWVDVDDETALRIMLADNRSSDLASNDFAELAKILEGLFQNTEALLAGTGYDANDLDYLIDSLSSETLPSTSSEAFPSNLGEPVGSELTKAMTLVFSNEQYENAMLILARLKDSLGLETYAECVHHLLDNWLKTSLK